MCKADASPCGETMFAAPLEVATGLRTMSVDRAVPFRAVFFEGDAGSARAGKVGSVVVMDDPVWSDLMHGVIGQHTHHIEALLAACPTRETRVRLEDFVPVARGALWCESDTRMETRPVVVPRAGRAGACGVWVEGPLGLGMKWTCGVPEALGRRTLPNSIGQLRGGAKGSGEVWGPGAANGIHPGVLRGRDGGVVTRSEGVVGHAVPVRSPVCGDGEQVS